MDLAVQIHLNAFWNPIANGAECWVFAPGGRRTDWAQKMQAKLATRFRDRGVKYKQFTFLKSTKMPAVIVEVGFITNSKDRWKIGAQAQSIGRDLADATLAELGLPLVGQTKPKKPPGPKPRPKNKPIYDVYTKDRSWGDINTIKEALRLAEIKLKAGHSVEIELR